MLPQALNHVEEALRKSCYLLPIARRKLTVVTRHAILPRISRYSDSRPRRTCILL